jgi:hypothetical protein
MTLRYKTKFHKTTHAMVQSFAMIDGQPKPNKNPIAQVVNVVLKANSKRYFIRQRTLFCTPLKVTRPLRTKLYAVDVVSAIILDGA